MYEKWETSMIPEAIEELEEMEKMVIADEVMTEKFYTDKSKRNQRIRSSKTHKTKERIKNRSYQSKADNFKKNCKKKGYSLKYKGETLQAHRSVPSNSLGWHRINLNIMGKSINGVKLGYIFDAT